MTQPYGAAYVRILADADGFEKDLKRQVQKAVDEVGKSTKFKEFEKSAHEAGEKTGEEVARGTEDGLRKKKPELKKAADEVGRDVGKSSGGGMLAGIRSALLSRAGLIGALVPLIAGVAGQASGAIPALLAAMPSLALAAASGIGTLIMAVHGFGEAVGAGAAGKTEAFNKALSKLAPSAQAVAREVVGLTGVFKGLQQLVQQAFFLPLEGSFARLAHNLLPTLRAGLPALAGDFGRMAASFLDGLGSKDALTGINSLLHALDTGLRPWIPLMGQFATTFAQVAGAAAPFIAALSGSAASAISGFLVSLNDSLGSGGALKFFNAAGSFFADLGGALGPVLGLLGDVLSAFSSLGSPTLAILGQLATTLRQVLEPILPVLAQVATVLVQGLGKNLQALTPGLVALGQALADGFGAVADQLPALFDALVPLFTEISTFLVQAGPAFGQLLVTLAQAILPALVQVLTDLQPLWAAMIPVLTEVATQLLPALVPLFGALLQVVLAFLPILPPLVDLFIAWVPVLLQLVTVLVPLIELLTQILILSLPFIDVFVQLVAWALKLVAAWVKIATNNTLIPFLSAVAWALDGIVDKVQKAVSWFDKLIGRSQSSKLDVAGGAASAKGAGAGGLAGIVPHFGSGGVARRPTLAVVGDAGAGVPEAIVPMGSRTQARQVAGRTGLLNVLGTAGGHGDTHVTVYLGTREITDIVGVVVDDKLDDAASDISSGTRG